MVNTAIKSYDRFSQWVQNDISKDQASVNRKVLSVVVWCLVFPLLMTVILYVNRKFQFFNLDRYTEFLIFFPALIFGTLSLWPTFRDLPRVFKKGGFTALIEDSQREISWRESTSARMKNELGLTRGELSLIAFHLKHDLERLRDQNRYTTILAGSVLFFMFQFLDLGAPLEIEVVANMPQALVKNWVEQFSQWSFQFFSLLVFSALFYLSGIQFHRYLGRYLVCVQRILESDE